MVDYVAVTKVYRSHEQDVGYYMRWTHSILVPELSIATPFGRCRPHPMAINAFDFIDKACYYIH